MPKLYHAFVSAVSDSTDTTIVRPSDWNGALEYASAAGTGPSGTDATVREVLTGARTYYVRTDGSDSNTGLANTAGGAFATFSHAVAVVAGQIDFAGQTVTIQIGDGTTWTTPFLMNTSWVGGGILVFDGNAKTLSVTSSHAIRTVGSLDGKFTVQNITLSTTTSGNCIEHGAVGTLSLGASVTFGASAGYHMSANGNGVLIIAQGVNYTISGNAVRHIAALSTGASVYVGSNTVTLTGTPAFSGAFAYADTAAAVASFGTTWSGSATGTRYTAALNGVINTFGGGANYFPGNAAGSTATGGQYA